MSNTDYHPDPDINAETNRKLHHRVEELEAKLADAHCLLQAAHAAVDPEAWPEISEVLSAALESCSLPHCQHLTEAEATIRSLATMLGWVDVPPQSVLEMSLSALQGRLRTNEAKLAAVVVAINQLFASGKLGLLDSAFLLSAAED